MKKKIFSLNVIAVLLIALFFAVTVGGCGGSSSSSIGGGDNSGNQGNNPGTNDQPVTEEDSATRPETAVAISFSMDSNGNGKPDVLDFNGVPQFHVDNSFEASSVFEPSSLLDAAEINLPVPSMTWLSRLRTQSENANVFSVPLEAGQEYTFEFSVNFTEYLGGVLPNIKIYDPSNSVVSLDLAKDIRNVTIAPYPPEQPSIVCYTITPEVSGNYIVKIANGEPTTNENADKIETGGVLFIYKERRNEDGDTGYYTRFKFQDAEGNKSQTVNINDIIHLRGLILEENPTYFEEVYGHKSADDEYGSGDENTSFELKNEKDDYAFFMDKVQARAGLIPVIDPDEEPEDEQENDDDYGSSQPSPLTTNKIVAASSNFYASALDDELSAIETNVYDIPYDTSFTLGRGFLAFSFLDPPGAGGADLTEFRYLLDQTMAEKEEVMHPKDSDTDYSNPTASYYYAKCVSTSSQAESLTKTSANVAVTSSAAGVSASTGSSNNFKFGLTATTLVIHYEVAENDYRTLTSKQLNEAWNDIGFLDIVNDYPSGEEFLPAFREDFGDYYVSGYQYGACFDAYISITTETSEQVKDLQQKLSANITSHGVTGSAEAAKETMDALKESKAEISIRVVTNGMGNGPMELNITHSKDIEGVNDVFTNLLSFSNQLKSNTKRSLFSPIRVKMTRYRNNLKLLRVLKQKGNTSGYIPITVGQAVRIVGLNSSLKDLRAYRNVVMDNQNIGHDYGVTEWENEFKSIITKVTTASERIYTGENQKDFDDIEKRVKELSPKFKAMGDRFAFYTKLVIAQGEEKKTYDDLKKKADEAGEGSDTAYANVRKMPFGSDRGGSSGYDQFAVSKYVTEDIQAGGDPITKHYKRDAVAIAYRIEWTSNHKKGDKDYLKAAGEAKITATTNDGSTARFCKVWVNSLDKDAETDRHRELVDNSSPAVGKTTVSFYFMSGRGDSVDWTIGGQSMRMRIEDYPFSGLQ